MPRKKGKAPYLGKNKLKWCPQDNIPVLKKKICPNCGHNTFEMKISPPGDVRPAFSKDLALIRDALDKNFGRGIGQSLIPEDSIVLINKVGGLDYNAEIILNGLVYGLFFYDPIRQKYSFKPKGEISRRILEISKDLGINLKNKIEISKDSASFILDGKSILAPGVVDFDRSIQKGDYCIIVNNNQYITTGIALENSDRIEQLVENGYGKVAKNIKRSVNHYLKAPNPQTNKEFHDKLIIGSESSNQKNWDFVYSVNSAYIDFIVEDAKRFIKKTHLTQKKRTAVAYSGGKDSLCTLLLVYDVLGPNFDIFFADTGLEFPEIIETTKVVVKLLGMENRLIIESIGDKFWDLIEDFGPPARDYRFCCHTLKSQQIMSIIESLSNGEKILSFLGQRRYESFSRAAEKKIYVNTFIPMQIAATPIKDWNALEVWLYLLYYPHQIGGKIMKIPITPLYFQGFSRLGCFICPATSLSSLNLINEIHPELISKWNDWLLEYAKKMEFPSEWVKYGLWRFKKISPLWKNTLKRIGIKYDLKRLDGNLPLKLMITKGFSPCVLHGGYSVKGKFNAALDLSLILHQKAIIKGNFELLDDIGVLTMKGDKVSINVFSDGSFYIRFPDKKTDIIRIIHKLIGIIVKSQKCNACDVCVNLCPNHLIAIEKNEQSTFPIINENSSNKCSSCNICITHCPVYQKIKDTFDVMGLAA
jgi:phosphoadenosine phosphosulfate reductase